MVHDPNALRALLGMQALSNQATPGVDPFVAKRRAQIYSGEDALANSEVEQRRAQMAEPTLGLSREQYRDDAMNKLKKTLGMQQIQAQQELALKMAPEQLKGEYDLRGREMSNEGQLNVAKTYAQQREETAAANNAARAQAQQEMFMQHQADPNRSMTVAGVGSIGAAPRQATPPNTTVPAPLYKAVDEAKAAYESYANNPLGRTLFGASRNNNYSSALTNLLDKKGTLQEVEEVFGILRGVDGATIEEKIANSGDPAMQALDPYERQYLQLKLGQ